MANEMTNSERYRRERAQQVKDRRLAIITAAAELFLEKGLEQTTMLDIAGRARISKVTLYRYFSDRDPLAFEVSVRMLKTILASAGQGVEQDATGFRAVRGICLGMIREFPALRSAYRYLGMFDHLYGDHYPSDELAAWYKQHIFEFGTGSLAGASMDKHVQEQIVTLLNAIMSFLEKMAARGELMGKEQEVPLQVQLSIFEEIVCAYLDSIKKGLSL
ncbi:MAG TPA: TetR/AcrR family transcriptional regulator [Anaerolineales bacterium]|nr:TetR/AcrR family transcriptional regulator [Anaerolineales bacterium]